MVNIRWKSRKLDMLMKEVITETCDLYVLIYWKSWVRFTTAAEKQLFTVYPKILRKIIKQDFESKILDSYHYIFIIIISFKQLSWDFTFSHQYLSLIWPHSFFLSCLSQISSAISLFLHSCKLESSITGGCASNTAVSQ